MNNSILQKNIPEIFEKIKIIFKILNFSDEEIIKQMKELGEIIMMSVFIKAVEGKDIQSLKGDLDEGKIREFLENNYSQSELQDIFKEEAKKVITDYFREILKNVSEEKLLAIEKVLKDIKELEKIREEIEKTKSKK